MIMVLRAIFRNFSHFFYQISVDSPCQINRKPGTSKRINHSLKIQFISIISITYLPMFSIIDYTQIKNLYSSDPTARYEHIMETFKSHYGGTPEFIARAPGRVNFIGEHIDYEGYGVLPAAIEKDCLIAVRKTQSQEIRINHVSIELYPATKVPVHPQAEVNFVNNYVKYFRAGYRAGVGGLPVQNLVGLDILIEGNVPSAAGVSSSSALCVCSALAAIHANQGSSALQNMEQFIERVITGERETGTASGGMDQSISVMGKTNFCLYIQFHPIRCTPVHLPEGSRYVVMNSLVESAKLNTAVFRYNKRVCQCRLAINILAKKLNMPKKANGEIYKILKELEDWSSLPLNTLGALVDAFLDRKDYNAQDIEQILEAPLQSFLSDIQLYKEVLEANKTFKLYEAARHVFDEAYRVLNFINVCNSKLEAKEKLTLLGKLMNESQASCRDLYECSCPEIDEITDLARKNGAYGSRLTGAGWGGCTISLVHADHTESFIKAMIDQYYSTKPELLQKIQKIGINNVVFESLPSEGACIISIDN